jgi:homoserine kinase
MTETFATLNEETAGAEPERTSLVEVRVPSSTSNLGAGFDCFGLALQLYLTVRACLLPEGESACQIESSGEGSETLTSLPEKNLIYRSMLYAAERANLVLPPLRLAVHNEIPLGRGLGSSAAAIVAGITLTGEVCGARFSEEMILRLATELEGHADNVAASLYGGWVTACVKEDGGVLAIKKSWPPDIKVLIVSPHIPLQTKHARAALPLMVDRADAVHNLQRAALFGAALSEGKDELLWEAMRDRLHQPHRQELVPGLTEALALPRMDGLLGLALSGAGPSIIALARRNFTEIGEAIADCFCRHHLDVIVRRLNIDNDGRKISRQKEL